MSFSSINRAFTDLSNPNTRAIILEGYGGGGLRTPYFELLLCQQRLLLESDQQSDKQSDEQFEASSHPCDLFTRDIRTALMRVVFVRGSVVRQGLVSQPWTGISALLPYGYDSTGTHLFLRLYFSSTAGLTPKSLKDRLSEIQTMLDGTIKREG